MAKSSCPSHLQVVKRGDRELKFKTAGLHSLAEELQFYILGFLSCRDILRCTSVSHDFVLFDFHTDDSLAGV
jgi:hypothetical protein